MKQKIKNAMDKIFYKVFPELNPLRASTTIQKDLNEIRSVLEPHGIGLVDFVEHAVKNDTEIFQFYRIKKITNGCLAPEIYRELCRCALNSPEGYMIDIGPE